MKNLLVIATLLIVITPFQGNASLCNDPIGANNVCFQMKNIRSHIMMLESQRDLMLLNYKYLQAVSFSLSSTAAATTKILPEDLRNHSQALMAISDKALSISQDASGQDPQVFVRANSLRTNCAACHTNDNPVSGHKWNEIFALDWNKIIEKCNSENHNPFLCKQMHGMISNYSYIFSAYQAGITDYSMLETAAAEIQRISKLLLDNGFLHINKEIIQDVNRRSSEVMELAQERNPQTMAKAYAITETCSQCHSPVNLNTSSKLNLNVWVR